MLFMTAAAQASGRRAPVDVARERARATIAVMAIVGIFLGVVGAVVLSIGATNSNGGATAGGIVLASIGGGMFWFSMTALAVWAGVQAARR